MKKTKFLIVLSAAALCLCMSIFAADFAKTRTYDGSFTDVADNSWYAGNVAAVYELSLMEGVAQDKFDTESEMSVAQAITIAARLHAIYNDKEIPEVENPPRWFQMYVDYAINNNIMTQNQFNSYTRSVLSFEMVNLFAAALPEEHYPAINSITYIQDVPENVSFHKDVLMFYNAGVLNGNDEVGTFLPMSAITRKRAAVILSRTALKDQRMTFSLSEKKQQYTVKEVLDIVASQTVPGTLDNIIVANAGDYKVSAGQYRYYSAITGGDKAQIEAQIKFDAALYSLLTQQDLTVPYDVLCDVLVNYYKARITNYGTVGYFDAVESQKLTDTLYAHLSSLNELAYSAVAKEIENVTDDYVYKFATENNFVRAKHILISKESENAYRTALEVNLALLDGKDFDELMAQYGEDPGMKRNPDGYIFTTGTMVEPFEKAAFALNEGEISDIVETTYGYHIIKRLSYDKEQLVANSDFAEIKSNAAAYSFYEKQSLAASQTSISYIENMDELSELLK